MVAARTQLIVLACALASQGCGRPNELSLGSDTCETPGLDPFGLSALGPTDRSHWLQPWRAYQDTWPAARMRNAIGVGVQDRVASAPMMARSGIARAVLLVQWKEARFDDPARLNDAASEGLTDHLLALQANGIRPLILVYGFEGAPAPYDAFQLRLSEPAAVGARTIRIDPTQVSRIVSNETGLSQVTGYIAAEILITAVTAEGVATLSKPLPKALAAGGVLATTLKFPPFAQPFNAQGGPNPTFERTVGGWIAFVKAVALSARQTLGNDAFDIELWNETVTGSMFLDINNYYDPPIERNGRDRKILIEREILVRTTLALREPDLKLNRMGIGNGFANTNWAYASSTEPAGTTALDRHVSVGRSRYPNDVMVLNSRTVDALGRADGRRLENGAWADGFTPSYSVLFPELPLNAILPYDARRPGQLIRDLAPLATPDINGVAHGRNEKPEEANVAPEVWITAVNTAPDLMPMGIDPPSSDELWRFKAKASLRALAAYVSKGAALVALYGPDGALDLIDDTAGDGGPVMRALARFKSAFEGPPDLEQPRALELVAVRGCDTTMMVQGNRTPAHPGLTDRDLVAFFPFQVTNKEFVVATYIMTRDLMQVQRGARNRFDLPARAFDLVIDGFASDQVRVQATDPLDGDSVDVTVKYRAKQRLIVSVPLTDSVRLLRFSEP